MGNAESNTKRTTGRKAEERDSGTEDGVPLPARGTQAKCSPQLPASAEPTSRGAASTLGFFQYQALEVFLSGVHTAGELEHLHESQVARVGLVCVDSQSHRFPFSTAPSRWPRHLWLPRTISVRLWDAYGRRCGSPVLFVATVGRGQRNARISSRLLRWTTRSPSTCSSSSALQTVRSGRSRSSWTISWRYVTAMGGRGFGGREVQLVGARGLVNSLCIRTCARGCACAWVGARVAVARRRGSGG